MRMKRVFYLLQGAIFLVACNETIHNKNVGKKIDATQVITTDSLKHYMTNHSIFVGNIAGKVVHVCEEKGCNMDLALLGNEAETIHVLCKDEAFTIPTDAIQQKAIAHVKVYYDTLAVAELRALAKDQGFSEKDIQAIQQPQIELVAEADGVMIE